MSNVQPAFAGIDVSARTLSVARDQRAFAAVVARKEIAQGLHLIVVASRESSELSRDDVVKAIPGIALQKQNLSEIDPHFLGVRFQTGVEIGSFHDVLKGVKKRT